MENSYNLLQNSETPNLPVAEAIIKVILIYIPVRSAGGGLIGVPHRTNRKPVVTDILALAETVSQGSSRRRIVIRIFIAVPASSGLGPGALQWPLWRRDLVGENREVPLLRHAFELVAEDRLFAPGDLRIWDEDEAAAAFAEASGVSADPMYAPVCPPDVPFFRLPHEAFSGRCYRKESLKLIDRPLPWRL